MGRRSTGEVLGHRWQQGGNNYDGLVRVHHSALAGRVRAGVGVEPGGFTPLHRPFDQAQGGEPVEPQAQDGERSRTAGGGGVAIPRL